MTRILTAFLAWSLTVVAVAQPPVTLGDGFDLAAPSDVTISGRRGVWFPMDQARAMLADVEELDLLRQQLVLTERLVQGFIVASAAAGALFASTR